MTIAPAPQPRDLDAEQMRDPRSTPHVPLRVLARAQAEGFTEALEPPLLR